MSVSRLVLVVSVILVILVGFTVFSRSQGNDKPAGNSNAEVVTSDAVGFTVEKNKELAKQELSPQDVEAGQLWRFVQPADMQQEFRITARYEQGESLKKLANMTNKPLREAVQGNLDLQLPSQYPGYKELSRRNTIINGVEVTEVIFSYNNKGKEVKQRLVLFFKNSDTVIYVQAQALADQYETVNNQYFEPLIASVKFN